MFFGEEPVDGRKLLRYDYDISYLNSGYLIKTQHGQARVAYHGSVWADPRILQPVLVEVNLRFVWPGTAIRLLHLKETDTSFAYRKEGPLSDRGTYRCLR